jgi:hypothetical protein
MRKKAWLVVCALVALAATGSAEDKILQFQTMTPVVRPFVGAANPIRGVNGGGIPWMLERADGQLRMDGRIEVRVRGLVLAEGANAGRNPIAQFKAIVSCLTPMTDSSGNPVMATVNAPTGLFPASETGDAFIQDAVSLPSPCIAPIVFVASPGGSWFAASGL